MQCTRVRQTELPGVTRLSADISNHPDRTARFYRHPRHDLEAFRAAARAVHLAPERRAALVEALRVQNPPSAALERLAQPGTLAVAAGQQVGLFSGPAYTIYKALHAARLAEWLTGQGLPAVPVFWLATEDHDFAEVNHVWVFDAQHQPAKLQMRRQAGVQPVGGIELAEPPVGELRAALAGLPFADETLALVAETYVTGRTMGQAFSDLLRRLLAHFDIPHVDPMLPAFRELAAPVLRRAVEQAPELTAAVLERNRELVEAGYHAQVHVEPQTAFFFLLENGKRLGLRRQNGDYQLNGRRFTSAELAGRAAELSPNALLRPVVQDAILPTVASVLGPAEAAYIAQSEVLYSRILGRMPVEVPRAGFTIIDNLSAKRIERYGVRLTDFFHGKEALRERMAAALIPPDLTIRMHETLADVDATVERLRARLLEFDPTLEKALATSARKIRHQAAKIQAKTAREAMRRDERASRDAASLYGLIYPERHLQERLYSILPFVAKHGFELVDRLYESIELDSPDHRLLVV
ncbi:MAG: bacillithiol biosynthesis cysteine-adding enzyme BshC [Bryobacteraceae bacterium]